MAKTDPDKEKKQRREFLKQAAEMLDDMKRGLMREMQDRVKGESEGVKDEGRDTYDLASDERDMLQKTAADFVESRLRTDKAAADVHLER